MSRTEKDVRRHPRPGATFKKSLTVHATRLREIASCPLCLQFEDKPALLAGAAALEASIPEPITEKHRDGNWWLVWEPFCYRWVTATWRERSEMWVRPDDGYVVAPTHALPVPPAPEGE